MNCVIACNSSELSLRYHQWTVRTLLRLYKSLYHRRHMHNPNTTLGTQRTLLDVGKPGISISPAQCVNRLTQSTQRPQQQRRAARSAEINLCPIIASFAATHTRRPPSSLNHSATFSQSSQRPAPSRTESKTLRSTSCVQADRPTERLGDRGAAGNITHTHTHTQTSIPSTSSNSASFTTVRVN